MRVSLNMFTPVAVVHDLTVEVTDRCKAKPCLVPVWSKCYTHYSVTLKTHPCLNCLLQKVTCSDIIYIQFISIFIYSNWSVGIFLKPMLGVCISQWKSVCVQLLFFCNVVRFAVKFVVPLRSFMLKLVMIISSSNKSGKMCLPDWCNPAVFLYDSCPEFCSTWNLTASAIP